MQFESNESRQNVPLSMSGHSVVKMSSLNPLCRSMVKIFFSMFILMTYDKSFL